MLAPITPPPITTASAARGRLPVIGASRSPLSSTLNDVCMPDS